MIPGGPQGDHIHILGPPESAYDRVYKPRRFSATNVPVPDWCHFGVDGIVQCLVSCCLPTPAILRRARHQSFLDSLSFSYGNRLAEPAERQEHRLAKILKPAMLTLYVAFRNMGRRPTDCVFVPKVQGIESRCRRMRQRTVSASRSWLHKYLPLFKRALLLTENANNCNFVSIPVDLDPLAVKNPPRV
jgi:hypothetical protein